MELERNMNISSLFEFYAPLLTERQREVVGLYYNDDLSLFEISELTSITRQGVRDAIKKSEEILLSAEEKLSLRKKHEKKCELLALLSEKIAFLECDEQKKAEIKEIVDSLAGL